MPKDQQLQKILAQGPEDSCVAVENLSPDLQQNRRGKHRSQFLFPSTAEFSSWRRPSCPTRMVQRQQTALTKELSKGKNPKSQLENKGIHEDPKYQMGTTTSCCLQQLRE